MKFLVNVLLCFFSAVAVVISTQQQGTIPYIHFRGVDLNNHSYVDLDLVGDVDLVDNVECRTDLMTCCNSNDGMDRGDWFHPDGVRLPFHPSMDNGPAFLRRSQSVNMRYVGTPVASDSGIYQCTIETVAVNNENNTAREILYLGIYSNGGDVIIPQDIHFTEVSGSGGFTLTCISTGGPATTVMWTRDSEILSEGLSTVLENRITAEYTHTLTVAGRLEGVYTCSVSNIKPSSATRELRVEVPSPPSDLQVSQTGQNRVLVSWTTVSGSVDVVGYTVYLTPEQGVQIVSEVLGASESNTTVTGPVGDTTYSITIVTKSNTFTSNVTGPVNITLAAVIVTLSSPSLLIIVGDSFPLTCSVTLPDGLTGMPTFLWEGPGNTPVSSSPSTSGQIVNSTLSISNIMASQAGQYNCTVSISFFTVSDTVDIVVQIPSPLPTITGSRSPPLYAATSYNLTCDYTLDALIDTNPSIAVNWTVAGSAVDTSQSRISVTNNGLVFNPLATSDSGSYVCTVTILAQEYVTVKESEESSSVDILVEGLPPLDVVVTSDAELNIGDQQTLECSVSVVSFLITEPSLEWVNPTGITLTSTTGQSLTHIVNVEKTSAVGVYVCQATLNVTAVGLSITEQSNTSITVQIPQPVVVISRDRSDVLYAGSSLTFTCTVSLDSRVDTLPNVLITWTGPRSIPGEWYTVTDTTRSGSTYSGNLSIIPLADDRDDGVYTCNVVVTGNSYMLEATSSDSTTLDITDLPPLVVNIATDGLLLTSQSFTFECTASLVDGLLQPPSLELVAPNGTTLAQGSGTTTLQYSLLSLDISDGGEYTCIINLTIPGSGIDRQVSATESITVVDAYPIEQLAVTSSSSSSLVFSWQPPVLGHNFTTGFKLTCVPLLNGILSPQPPSTSTVAEMTTLSLTGLHAGVPYNCSVVTVTTEGESEPRSVIHETEEIPPSGNPSSFQVVVGTSDVTFSWSPPEVTLRNGDIVEYVLSCSPRGSAVMTVTIFTEPGTYMVDGFSANTDYNCSVIASNSKGSGPPATLLFTTQAGGDSSASFDSVPVVTGTVVIVLIIAVMVVVIVVVVVIAKKRRHKYNLNRARPNSYITRAFDSGSAIVTANPSADYEAKNLATNEVPPPEYEMIQLYSKIPPGQRLAQEYSGDGVDITTNTHVTSALNNHSTNFGQNSEYEMLRTYSNIGPDEHQYEEPKVFQRSVDSQYEVPRSRHNTVNPLYCASRNNTMTQGLPPGQAIATTAVTQDLYNIPRSRQNTTTEQSPPVSAPEDVPGKTAHDDQLSSLEKSSTTPRENKQVPNETGKAVDQNTYAVPRPSSTVSQKPSNTHSHLVAIDLGREVGFVRPVLAHSTGTSSALMQSSGEQREIVYQEIPD